MAGGGHSLGVQLSQCPKYLQYFRELVGEGLHVLLRQTDAAEGGDVEYLFSCKGHEEMA